jgi:hypothetical protein
MANDPAEIFYAYSHRDEALRNELEKHLSILRRSGAIASWHDRKIDAGSEWQSEIDGHINSANVILLLISSDFVASDYCHDVEMRCALERHSAGEATVIPVILRPVDWKGSEFGHLQALPTDGKPVTTWDNVDDALKNVAEGIRTAIGDSRKPMRYSLQSAVTSVRSNWILEGAVPAVMPQLVSRDVVAMVSTTNSPGLVEALSQDDTYSPRSNDVKRQAFEIECPTGLELPILVRLWAPDFEPPMQENTIALKEGLRSPPIVFFIQAAKPRTDLLLKLELLVESRLIATRLLKTNVTPNRGAEPEPMSLSEPVPRHPPRPPRGWSVVVSIPLTVKRIEAYSPSVAPGVRK